MLVYKFGGTSVGSPANMRSVAELLRNGEKKIVVLSAVSGTTNTLVELAAFLYRSEKESFVAGLNDLQHSYENFAGELLNSGDKKSRAKEILSAHFNYMRNFSEDLFTIYEERAILAEGELLSTALFQLYCEEIGIRSKLLPALDFMRINNQQEPDDYYIKVNLERLLNENPDFDIYISQGFICRNAFGEIDNLKRGGSDYSASLIGAAIGAAEIQIWTDIDGMHNNDPRVVESTKTIENLSFDEAAELAYFGAKILHPSSVRPAREKNIPVRLKNTMHPEASGTLISAESRNKGITAVAAKDGITAIKIRSGRMLMAYGFLRAVFQVFELYKTSIDLVTTSEVAVSLTIDDDTHLDRIAEDLRKFGMLEIDRDQSIVCIVGDFMANKAGFLAIIANALKDIPLRMVSYGGSRNNISFLVNSDEKNAALKALHLGLFKEGL